MEVDFQVSILNKVELLWSREKLDGFQTGL